MAGKSSRLAILLDLDGTQFEKGLNRSLSRFKSASKQMQSAGKNLSMGLTAPLALVGASSFKVAADFELAMAKVAAVSGGGDKALKSLTDQAKNLGATTSFSASEVSSLQLELSKLGFTTADLVGKDGMPGMTNSVLNLSKAFDTDLGETATVVGATLRQFGMDSKDTQKVTDIMAKSFGASALDLVKFSESMKNAGPVANEFGFSLEETTALLGVMANNGIAGSDAGTKLKMAFSELAKSGVPVKDTFTKLIQGGAGYTEAMDMLGTRAAILGPIFGKNLDDLSKLNTEFKNSSGTAQAMSDMMGNTTAGKLAEMQSAIEAAQIELGQALAPTILEVVNVVRDLASSFANLDAGTKEVITKIAMAAAALGPMLIVGGKVTGAVGSMSNAFKLFGKAASTNAGGAMGAFKKLIPLLMNPAFLAGAAAIAAIAYALKPVVERMTSFEYKTRTAAGAMKEMNKRTAEESAEARVLFTDLKNAVSMERDRADAIDAIQKKYPDYIGNLDLNTASLEDIAKLEKQVTDAIGDRVRAQLVAEAQAKKMEAMTKVEKSLFAAENTLLGEGVDPKVLKETSNAVRNYFNEIANGTKQASGSQSMFFGIAKAIQESGKAANMSWEQIMELARQYANASTEGEGTGGLFGESLAEIGYQVADAGASLRQFESMMEAMKVETEQTTDATKAETKATKENTEAKKAQGEAVTKTKKETKTLADTLTELADTLAETSKTESVFGENFGARDEDRMRALSSAINEIIGEGFTGDVDLSALELTADQLQAIGALLGEDFSGDVDAVLASLVSKFKEMTPAVESTGTPLEALRAKMAELQMFQRVGLIDGMEAAQEALTALETALSESLLNDPNFEGTEQFTKMVDEIERMRAGLQGAGEEAEATQEKFDMLGAAQQATTDLANAAVDAIFDKEQSFLDSAKNIAKGLLKQALSTAIANAIAAAFSPASPDNIVTGGAAAPAKAAANKASALALFASIPAFAEGGAVLGGRGGTLALIGEKPSSRGEFIVPFEKMGRFMEMAGGGSKQQINARVLGDHLLLSSDRSKRKLSRRSTI